MYNNIKDNHYGLFFVGQKMFFCLLVTMGVNMLM